MGKDQTTENQEEQKVENTAEEQEEQSAAEEAKGKKESKKEDGPLEKLQGELTESKDKYLRLYSEFENYRRRTSKEKIDFMKTATEDLIKDLLPILDDFERAQSSFPEAKDDEKDPVREGFDLIYKKFKNTLEKQGVTEIENPKGKELDTNLHEAITQFPAPSEDLKGKIVDQVEKGYMLGEKVVRFAKVVVGI
ncbi:nucleotide exchange factor GrpE [Chondrinema litorale]|uniref:nucleotide exchange factor GrpE n=1 Tax=Chondrinema litorale TaxID=2994555 RepID=UPI0025437BAD|nr:nucleotide exchange factor GrpE [Chondrinema litorale]UZR95438.1 nucleotide exchange factor GrpE [Chondrinema litorale]